MFTYLADLELETIVGGGRSYSSYKQQPKEVITLNSHSSSFTYSSSSLSLQVFRTGKGAGQGSPVSISLG